MLEWALVIFWLRDVASVELIPMQTEAHCERAAEKVNALNAEDAPYDDVRKIYKPYTVCIQRSGELSDVSTSGGLQSTTRLPE